MFDIGWGELVVIGIVALIAIGPKELPGALRTMGQWMGKVRRMASEFQSQFQEAMREAEMADIKQQVETLTSGFDPIETTRKEIETAMEDKPAAAGSPSPDAGTVEAPPAAAAEPTTAPAAVPETPVPAASAEQTAAPSPAATGTAPEFTYDSGLSERDKLHEPADDKSPGGRPA
jgi:sec-independent protein translocase protein TatB